MSPDEFVVPVSLFEMLRVCRVQCKFGMDGLTEYESSLSSSACVPRSMVPRSILDKGGPSEA